MYCINVFRVIIIALPTIVDCIVTDGHNCICNNVLCISLKCDIFYYYCYLLL